MVSVPCFCTSYTLAHKGEGLCPYRGMAPMFGLFPPDSHMAS